MTIKIDLTNSPDANIGYCPQCGAPGKVRARGGYDTCANGHTYLSITALADDPEAAAYANQRGEDDKVEPYSAEEARANFMRRMAMDVVHWSTRENISAREMCNGLAFSFLNILDGHTDMPPMDIVLRPHEDDMPFALEHKLRYYIPGMVINNCTLHKVWYKYSSAEPWKQATPPDAAKITKQVIDQLRAEPMNRQAVQDIITKALEQERANATLPKQGV